MPQLDFGRLAFDPAGHTYRLDGRVVKSNTQILKAAGLIDDRFYTEESRDRGVRIHKAVEMYEGETLVMDQVDADVRPRLEGYFKFKRDTGFVAELVETRVFSDEHSFATTLDLLGRMQGTRDLIDIKSGATNAWNELQLGGQDVAICERLYARDLHLEPINGSPYPTGRFILQLRPDATYRLIPYNNPMARAAFVGAIHYLGAQASPQRDAFYRWMAERGVER